MQNSNALWMFKVLVVNPVGYIMNPTDVRSWAPIGKISLNHISLKFFHSLVPLYESLNIILFSIHGYCNTSLAWITCCIPVIAILAFQTTYFYNPERAKCEMDQIFYPDCRLWHRALKSVQEYKTDGALTCFFLTIIYKGAN